MYQHVHTYINMHKHACTHMHTYVYKNTYTYVHTCAPTHIHTCTSSLSPWKGNIYLYALANFLTHDKLHLVLRKIPSLFFIIMNLISKTVQQGNTLMSTILISNVAWHHYRPTMRSRIRHHVHNWYIVYKTPIWLF